MVNQAAHDAAEAGAGFSRYTGVLTDVGSLRGVQSSIGLALVAFLAPPLMILLALSLLPLLHFVRGTAARSQRGPSDD